MKFKVEKAIFEKWPRVRIGVVVEGMNNRQGGQEIAQLLAAEEEKKRQELAGVDIKEHPRVAPWREKYRQFGSKPREHCSSIEALLRRVVAGKKIPSINPLVDLYNYISLKHFLTAGAEDLDQVKGDIVLKICRGDEKGKYIGSNEISSCYPGEVAYGDDLGFICRRWNWRKGDRTKITPETKNAVVVLEAHEKVSDEELQVALRETAELIKKHLSGRIAIEVLDKGRREFEIEFEEMASF